VTQLSPVNPTGGPRAHPNRYAAPGWHAGLAAPTWPRRSPERSAPTTTTSPPTPELVNADPCGQGLDAEVDIDPATLDQQPAGLMDARAYHDLAGD
jgi:hypothetical protein